MAHPMEHVNFILGLRAHYQEWLFLGARIARPPFKILYICTFFLILFFINNDVRVIILLVLICHTNEICQMF